MKKFVFTFKAMAMFAIVSFTLISCSEDGSSSIVYSCNETVDTWVKEHKATIQRMNRRDWKDLNEDVSHASYLAFTQDQKINFWCDKIKEVKALGWNAMELQHLDKVINYVLEHKRLFEDGHKLSEYELNDLDLFFYKWKEHATVKLGWTESLCYAIIASGNELINKKGEVQKTGRKSKGISTGPDLGGITISKCNCNTQSDYCGFPINPAIECYPSTCTRVDGCGTLFLKECNGRCANM